VQNAASSEQLVNGVREFILAARRQRDTLQLGENRCPEGENPGIVPARRRRALRRFQLPTE
jgi:hypothetical protein